MSFQFGDDRYSRQIAVPLLGVEGQARLAKSSVAVIGAGGVKSPILLYLAAAGIGRIRVIDFDRVELSNLNRQVLYRVQDIGRNKAVTAVRTLQQLNPEIVIEAREERAHPDNYDQLLHGFDLIYEGGDGFQNRVEFNRWALDAKVPYVHASAHYNYSVVTTIIPHKTHCLECIYEHIGGAIAGEPVPVLGPAAGLAGVMAASEGINIIATGVPAFADKLWFCQGWSGTTCIIDLSADRQCSHG